MLEGFCQNLAEIDELQKNSIEFSKSFEMSFSGTPHVNVKIYLNLNLHTTTAITVKCYEVFQFDIVSGKGQKQNKRLFGDRKENLTSVRVIVGLTGQYELPVMRIGSLF